jgi:hypothetical protein
MAGLCFRQEVVFLCVVLGFELRAYTFSHSTIPIFVIFFFNFIYLSFLRWDLTNYLPGLPLNHDPPDLCLLSS